MNAYRKFTRNLPPVSMMIGKYLGYKFEEPEADTAKMTTEQHAKRLLEELGISPP